MVRSIAVIMVPLLVIVFLFTNNLRDHPVESVDYAPVLQTARAEAPWPVLAPTGLPTEGGAAWTPTRVSWQKLGQPGLNDAPSPRNEWKIGYLGPDEIYYSVNQGDGPPTDFIGPATSGGAKLTGDVTAAGRQWERFEQADGPTRSLVNRSEQVTTVVSADADFDKLAQFAETLGS